jgi:dTDP-4-amino-4,6-dideoxygalactose transaminase
MAVDVGPGDEVICSPFSFTASSAAIVTANAIPVFADIDLETFCLSPETAAAAVTKSTKALMAVHWNGNAGDLSSLMSLASSKKLKVIEDASQAPGNKYQNKYLGTYGDVGVFSLNEPKNIMTGEGGIVVTNNERVAIKSRLIRNHGEAIVDASFDDDMMSNIIGYNFRLVEILAELGVHQVQKLEHINGIRRENYLYLVERLQSVCGEYLIPQKITHLETYSPYHVGFRWLSEKSGIHRNLIIAVLRKEGIPISQGISRLMSNHPLFQRQLAYGLGHCPFSCHLYEGRKTYKVPALPNATRLHQHEYIGLAQVGWPNTKNDMDDIVQAFEKIMANKKLLQNEDFKITDEFISWR